MEASLRVARHRDAIVEVADTRCFIQLKQIELFDASCLLGM